MGGASQSRRPAARMTVRMRLQRFGRIRAPFYRVVVTDSRKSRNGAYIECVGTYNPIADKSGTKHVRLDQDRIQYWMSVGVQPSDTVNRLLGQANILPSVARREPPADQKGATAEEETTEETNQ